MAWQYEQATGIMRDAGGVATAEGYSGNGDGKNNPGLERAHNLGPIPRGIYEMTATVEHSRLGPFAIELTPNIGNQMFGRSGFWVHGDSVERPGDASDGCIVLPLQVREQLWYSDDHALQVV